MRKLTQRTPGGSSLALTLTFLLGLVSLVGGVVGLVVIGTPEPVSAVSNPRPLDARFRAENVPTARIDLQAQGPARISGELVDPARALPRAFVYPYEEVEAKIIHNDPPDYAWLPAWGLKAPLGGQTFTTVGQDGRGRGESALTPRRYIFWLSCREARTFGALSVAKDTAAKENFHVSLQ